MNPNIFREYDIRGIVETDLTEDVVELLGKSYGTYMKRLGYKNFSVGCDVRLSSGDLKRALVKGILSTGGNVIDIGVLPTPAFYFSIAHLNMDGGVMITGSHNPIEYNGFKLNNGLGSVYGEEIQTLRRLIEADDFELGEGVFVNKEILNDYKSMLKRKIKFGKKLKIVMDPGNGTGGLAAPEVFKALGADVTCIFCEPDGHFPNHLPDPTVLNYIRTLRDKVIELGADIGLGYDGDSDRVGVIDNTGRVIFADRLLALLAKDVLKRYPGGEIIFDVKCSQALAEEIEKNGGKPLMWKTGHALLKSKLQEDKAPLAGEMSGHIFFADDYYGFDDAIYVSLRLAQLLSMSDKTMAELADEIPAFYSTPEIRMTCAEEEKFKIVKELSDYFKARYETIDVDGVRVLFGDGWGLVRASNTQPVLVLRFEAKSESRLKEIIAIFVKKLKEYPSVQLDMNEFTIVRG
ncbi:phosphomannomutase/phosphoglucomutase [bacterium BMS3Abin05]|nr:phosphomannomutase/phosphoglucomutase [bacterium BMS3Abin05]GBE26480.1 phosphomannomutase/phosphoglucomutase [bacterium BMS3Bbin03]HDZ12476.1 phosphomannomutase/phosphoglucomutase [Bacteroidota bacterium]